LSEHLGSQTVFVCIHVESGERLPEVNSIEDTFMCVDCWNLKEEKGELVAAKNLRAICKHCWEERKNGFKSSSKMQMS